MLRLIRHTLRFPFLSGLSLLMAVACTSLVLVLPGITMRFIDTIIGKNRPDLILSTALIGAGAILARQILFTLRSYLNNHLELKLTHVIRVELYDKLQRLPIKWFDKNSSGEIMSRVADDVPDHQPRDRRRAWTRRSPPSLQFLIVLGYLLYHSWELTLVVLVPLPFHRAAYRMVVEKGRAEMDGLLRGLLRAERHPPRQPRRHPPDQGLHRGAAGALGFRRSLPTRR